MGTCNVAVVGAGPYGLSAAAHLLNVKGLTVRVFGEPMSFWEHHMPSGMLLRSPWVASHLSDPAGMLTLDAYRKLNGNHFAAPIPLERFIDYGRWFQRRAVPDVDKRQVKRIEADSTGFQLTLEDGESLPAHRVVVATGIASFAWRPEPFQNLPPSLASHASEHHELNRFAGRQVVVVGGGQSALESAALMHEAGAEVEVIVRAPIVQWLRQHPLLHKWPIEPLLYAPPDVGPALVSHLVARPNVFWRLPRRWQDRLGSRSIRPAGARWLKPRLNGVPILAGRFVVSAIPVVERLKLKLDDGSERTVDHVLMGTGYRVNIACYPFLSPRLLVSVRQIDGFPQLDDGFESSVRGLHFLGAPAAWSFGPLVRFVAGADFAARALVRRVASELAALT
jgi:Pyridine nucleotide-disulphide oxidoreductase